VHHQGWTDPTKITIDPQPPALLTEKETRHHLNVSQDTLRKMVRDKEIIAIKVRGRWRFRQADVDRYLADRQNTRPE